MPWIVLADPEGNEFCVLEPRERYLRRGPVASIVVDAESPAALARFWEAASGWRIGFESEVVVSLSGPDEQQPDLDFVAVADAKSVKNRVHLDVAPFAGDDRDADVAQPGRARRATGRCGSGTRGHLGRPEPTPKATSSAC